MKETFTKKRHFSAKWRGVILASIALPVCSILYYLYMYTGYALEANHTLVTALVAAPFAYCLWLWRDQNKIKDQEHVERELKIKENRDRWDNFLKYQEIILSSKEDLIRASAVHAMSEYYETDLALTVHEFLKSMLNNFWCDHDADDFQALMERYRTNLPCWIIAIHNVILIKADVIRELKLGLNGLDLQHARLWGINLSGCNLQCTNFYKATLHDADFRKTQLMATNLKHAGLARAKFKDAIIMGADFEYAYLSEADFENAMGWNEAHWMGAKYNKHTKFPADMNPDDFEMKRVSLGDNKTMLQINEKTGKGIFINY